MRPWNEAFADYAFADRDGALGPADLENFAGVAHLLGRTTERDALYTRAQQAFIDQGDTESAARCAFWFGFQLGMTGEYARAGGWLARAQRLLDEAGSESVMRGYLILPPAIRRNEAGAPAESNEMFARVLEIARRFDDRSLTAFARLGLGRSLIRLSRIDEGVSLLDEVMVAVTAGDVKPAMVTIMYCSVIDACHEVFDLRRAQEWTDALSRWFAAQPDVTAFRGQCLIHRSEMMQLHGEWPGALDEARRACEWLSDPPGQPGAGAAFYRSGELHRVRGAFTDAESAYRAASECGRRPHPGLALLWLAQGRTDAAVAAIRPLVAERQDSRVRVQVLEACVEIMLAANAVGAAGAAAAELSEFAKSVGAPYLLAAAAHARGAVLLADDQAQASLADLGDAWSGWRTLGAPFEAARTRLLIAAAHRALGDVETSSLELEAARHAFDELGAAPDLARATALLKPTPASAAGELTRREVEVLRVMAAGKTNRAIASALGISEKTVARHVSNIFMKLGLSNRAAATAYAYEHKLTTPPRT